MSEETQDNVAVEVVEAGADDSGLSHEDALKELAKVRKEAAARRVKNREVEEKATKWEEYVASQKSELEKLADKSSLLEADNAKLQKELVRERVGRSLKDPEDFEFLVGDTQEELEAKAAKLNERASKRVGTNTFAGERGTPVVAKEPKTSQDWFEDFYKSADSKTPKF